MKIIIIGAGELGRMLAEKLAIPANDVVIIDAVREGIDRIRDKLDVLSLSGHATNVRVMKQAGIENTDKLLAVSGDQASNMLACQIAHKFGVKDTICRIYSFDGFSEEDGVTPEFFGIDKAFSSPDECARHVVEVIQNQYVLEQVDFSNPMAAMVTVRIPSTSVLKNMRVQDIPNTQLMDNIRLAALVRGQTLKFPNGNTQILENDKVYVAGSREYIKEFLDYVSGESNPTRRVIVIGGATRLCEMVVQRIEHDEVDIRIIERDKRKAEAMLGRMPATVKMILGDARDEDTLLEAGVNKCDVFVSAEDDDEDSILGCIIAKRLGAKKVVAVTHKPEYINIVPAMDVIDCGFNSTVVSANTVLRLMKQTSLRIDSLLKNFQAYFTEMCIGKKSRLVGKCIRDCKLPQNVVLALIFRKEQVFVPTGKMVLEEGDVAVMIVTPEAEEQLKPYFA